ncbi:hypothetical protein BGZ82_010373 [Podila clonocystis]|nr:hypothetical protein BGZ82_010373 [Podila clonocystis]
MVFRPRKPKTRLCLLLGAAVVLFHAVALTTPVFAAKAEQHALDTAHSTPKASKDHSKNNVLKLPKNKKTQKKTAQNKIPTIRKDTSLVDTVLEATKMDAASLQNSIAGLWDNVVQFGKHQGPALQAEIDQVLRKEHIDLSKIPKIQGVRNLEQLQQQEQNNNAEVILTRRHRRAAGHKSRLYKKNKKRGQHKRVGGRRKGYGHRRGAGKRRGGKHHRKHRHVGHSVPAPPAPVVAPVQPAPDALAPVPATPAPVPATPAPVTPAPVPATPAPVPATPAPPVNNVDTGAPISTGDTNVPVNNPVVSAPNPRRPRRKGRRHRRHRPRPIAAQVGTASGNPIPTTPVLASPPGLVYPTNWPSPQPNEHSVPSLVVPQPSASHSHLRPSQHLTHRRPRPTTVPTHSTLDNPIEGPTPTTTAPVETLAPADHLHDDQEPTPEVPKSIPTPDAVDHEPDVLGGRPGKKMPFIPITTSLPPIKTLVLTADIPNTPIATPLPPSIAPTLPTPKPTAIAPASPVATIRPGATDRPVRPSPHPVLPHDDPKPPATDDDGDDDDPTSPSTPDAPDEEDIPGPAIVASHPTKPDTGASPAEPKDTPQPTSLPDDDDDPDGPDDNPKDDDPKDDDPKDEEDDPLDRPSTPNDTNDNDPVVASPHVPVMPKAPAPAPVTQGNTDPISPVEGNKPAQQQPAQGVAPVKDTPVSAGPVPVAVVAGAPAPAAEAPIPPSQQQQSNAPVANPLPLAPTEPKPMESKPTLPVPAAEPDDEEEEDEEEDEEKIPNNSALVDDEGSGKEDGPIEYGLGLEVGEDDDGDGDGDDEEGDIEDYEEEEEEEEGEEEEEEVETKKEAKEDKDGGKHAKDENNKTKQEDDKKNEKQVEEEDKKKTQKNKEEGGEKQEVTRPVLQKRQVLVQAMKKDKLEAKRETQAVLPDAVPVDANAELKQDKKAEKKETKNEEEAATAVVADNKKEDKPQADLTRVEEPMKHKEQPAMEPAKELEPVAKAAVKEVKEKKEKMNHKSNNVDLDLDAQQDQNVVDDYNTEEIVFADDGAHGKKVYKNKKEKKDKDRVPEEDAPLDKNGLEDNVDETIQPLADEQQEDKIDRPVEAAKAHKKYNHKNNENQDGLEPLPDGVEDAPLQDDPTFEVLKGHDDDDDEKEDKKNKKKKKDKHDKEDKGKHKDKDNKDLDNSAPPALAPPAPALPEPAQNNNKPAPKGQQGNTAPQAPQAGGPPDRNAKAGTGTAYGTVPMFGPAQLDLGSGAVKLSSGWRAHATAVVASVIAVVFAYM